MRNAHSDDQLRLLLVDDHTVVREGLKRLLDPHGNRWSIIEAGTGYQALECLRQEAFDLGIADLSLPGMSGLDLMRRIREEFPGLQPQAGTGACAQDSPGLDGVDAVEQVRNVRFHGTQRAWASTLPAHGRSARRKPAG